MTAAPFRWGITSSATGSEGAAPRSDWSAWEREGRVPRSNDGNGWTTNFIDDLTLLATLGIDSIRITAEWARIEPEPGVIDRAVVDRYRRTFEAARANGLALWVTLHNGSLPGWFADDEHGFRDERARRYYWPRHVDRCAEWFEGLVDGWTPIEDATGWAVRSHLLGTIPPGRRDRLDTRDAVQGAIEANETAATLLHGGGQTTLCTIGIGAPHIIAAADELTIDRAAWAYVDLLHSGSYDTGVLAPMEFPGSTGCFDYLGLVHRAEESTDAQILTECVYRAAEMVNGRPIIIAGNSIATADEERHEAYVRQVVQQIGVLRADGVALHGYFHHTGIDGYEWHDGFHRPRGLIDRDRRLKPTGIFLRDYLSERSRR